MKPRWHDNRLMRGDQELARIEAHGEYWRVYYRGRHFVAHHQVNRRAVG